MQQLTRYALLVVGFGALSAYASDYPRPASEADALAIKSILVQRHPELAASPGIRSSQFFPGLGEPGCELNSDAGSQDAVQWLAIGGESIEDIQRKLDDAAFDMPCRQAQIDIYLEPFRTHAGLSDGAFVRCFAPVQDPEKQSPLDWSCNPVVFRQYVQLDDQGCEVTVVGSMSSAGLRAIKQLVRASIYNDSIEENSVLVKFQRLPKDQAFAIFGSPSCQPSDAWFHFKFTPGSDPDLAENWTLTSNR